ncbi:inactive rhomboid protein 2-like [Artemia franciscana]|uniref:inactive rhomboid protein 2-like n=1 Tax=Artemia franciscana TaxID=6661 RepID=UPI0032DB040A
MEIRKENINHMNCELIGRPCCIGILGECRILTREHCMFLNGKFHSDATLCSQVDCMGDVCGMIPFLNPDRPDQFYRVFISLFIHAGIVHFLITLGFQFIIMRDLERLCGPLRVGLIYFGSGIAGNLASAIFIPYRAEVGPAGSQFGILAAHLVEVIHAWHIYRRPWNAIKLPLMTIFSLFLIGLIPMVDNYAHFFGFLSGFLLSFSLLPFISIGDYDRKIKVSLIVVSILLYLGLLTLLVIGFYIWPIENDAILKFFGYFNCVPVTNDFCAEQNIHWTPKLFIL